MHNEIAKPKDSYTTSTGILGWPAHNAPIATSRRTTIRMIAPATSPQAHFLPVTQTSRTATTAAANCRTKAATTRIQTPTIASFLLVCPSHPRRMVATPFRAEKPHRTKCGNNDFHSTAEARLVGSHRLPAAPPLFPFVSGRPASHNRDTNRTFLPENMDLP